MFDTDTAPSPDPRDPVFCRNELFSTETVVDEICVRMRKNETIILRRLGEVGQCVVASGIGVNDAQITRMKQHGDFLRAAKILAILGLKVVPVSATVSFTPDEYK